MNLALMKLNFKTRYVYYKDQSTLIGTFKLFFIPILIEEKPHLIIELIINLLCQEFKIVSKLI